jgi:hypothetical protein
MRSGAPSYTKSVRAISKIVAAIFLCLSIIPQLRAQTPCVELLEKPTYNPLARMAGIEGIVKVHFSIEADGIVSNVLSEGQPLLVQSVETGIIRTHIGDSHCEGNYDLEYRFGLNPVVSDDSMLSVTFAAPNQFFVATNLTKVSCTYSVERRLSWFRRIFQKSRAVLAHTPCSLVKMPLGTMTVIPFRSNRD